MADRSFGPTLLLGLAGSGLAVTAGHRPWLELSAPGAAQGAADWFWQNNPGIGEMPATGALGLVVLASWGVLLVTRGAWRRVVAGLGLVAALGLGATWVTGVLTLRGDVEARVVEAGLAEGWMLGWTTWVVLAGVAVLLLLPAHAIALRRAPRWPAMGSRYDAPSSRAGGATAEPEALPTEADPIDVWRAIDEGRDPTT